MAKPSSPSADEAASAEGDNGNAIGRLPLSSNSEHAVHTLGHSTARGDPRTILKRVLGKSYLFLVLLLIIMVGQIVSPNFLSVRNASNVVAFSSIIALLAVGQFYVILTAESTCLWARLLPCRPSSRRYCLGPT